MSLVFSHHLMLPGLTVVEVSSRTWTSINPTCLTCGDTSRTTTSSSRGEGTWGPTTTKGATRPTSTGGDRRRRKLPNGSARGLPGTDRPLPNTETLPGTHLYQILKLYQVQTFTKYWNLAHFYWFFMINPFVPEFFFPSFFVTWLRIGSFRLPTHSRDAHRKFFEDPFLN